MFHVRKHFFYFEFKLQLNFEWFKSFGVAKDIFVEFLSQLKIKEAFSSIKQFFKLQIINLGKIRDSPI